VSWTLSASGHTPALPAEPGQESPGWASVEQQLFGELQAVLSKPEYGAAVSDFHGNYVHGEPHAKPEDSTHTHEHTDDEDDGNDTNGEPEVGTQTF
jgi:hypothetical protein